jgi:sigma-B regulation protein RsbU (phosphoserine phosphatase)
MLQELLITTSDGSNTTVQLSGDRYLLGRSPQAELFFPQVPGLSRQHALLERDQDRWVLSDVGSTNGTFLNGNRVTDKQKLRADDTITAGQLLLVYREAAVTSGGLSAGTVMFKAAAPIAHDDGAVRTNLQKALEIGNSRENTMPLDEPKKQWLAPLVALLRAGKQLNEQRPLTELFQNILNLSIETTGAERGVLLTLENNQLVAQASRGENFRISTTVRDTVLRDKTSLLVLDTAQDVSFKEQQSIVMQQVRTLMAVPLQTDTEVIGLLYLDSRTGLRMWTAEDLNLLTIIANVAAMRVERERMAVVEAQQRLLAMELSQAAEIQRGFLPRSAPSLPGFDIAGHNAACRTVGGDYFDFLMLPDGRLAFLLGDVAGKGMPAALMMMNLQARAQVLVEALREPGEFLTRLNRIITANCPQNRFITLFFAVLDPATGIMEYGNAGHNPPLILRQNGAMEFLPGGGPILGVMPTIQYQSYRAYLQGNEIFCVYSDGVTEACNGAGEEFGEERLGQSLARARNDSAAQLIDRVGEAVDQWTGGAPPSDDVTLVIVKRQPGADSTQIFPRG